MCRSCAEGGRRCPRTDRTARRERAASRRYYQRGQARRRIAELGDVGIPAVTDLDLPATFHTPQGDSWELDHDQQVENPTTSTEGPQGALWTAPGRQNTGTRGPQKTAWTDWTHQHDPDTVPGSVTRIEPQPGTVVVCLDTPDDAENLRAQYGRGDGFDWDAMRRDGIDGVYVSDTLARHPHDQTGLHGWTTAAVAWLATNQLKTTSTHTVDYTDEDDTVGRYRTPRMTDPAKVWDKVPSRFRDEDDQESTDDLPAPAPLSTPPAPERRAPSSPTPASPSPTRTNVEEGPFGILYSAMITVALTVRLANAAQTATKKGKKRSATSPPKK